MSVVSGGIKGSVELLVSIQSIGVEYMVEL
jgi:hypothetical protein